MKNIKFEYTILLVMLLPTYVVQANIDTENNDELRTELQQIKQRLSSLEIQNQNSLTSNSFNFYGSLRPTFGITHMESEDIWDVRDASSRIGFTAEHPLGNGLVSFAKG